MAVDERLSTEEVTPELVSYVVERIARAIEPVKIIVFGSHARGNSSPESDLDLLVIEDGGDPSRVVRRRIEDLLWGRRFGLDLVVRKPEQVEANLRAKNPFYASEVFEHGRVLYERK